MLDWNVDRRLNDGIFWRRARARARARAGTGSLSKYRLIVCSFLHDVVGGVLALRPKGGKCFLCKRRETMRKQRKRRKSKIK